MEKLGASNRTELAFLLTIDRSGDEKQTFRLDNYLVGRAILETVKVAYETAEYLLKWGRLNQRPPDRPRNKTVFRTGTDPTEPEQARGIVRR